MSRNIIRNQNVLDPPHRKARRSTAPYERLIETVTIKVWDKGCTDDEMADQLEHVAEMLRQGYQSGEIISEGNRGGWWDTTTPEGT